jgi:hypothetical protein
MIGVLTQSRSVDAEPVTIVRGRREVAAQPGKLFAALAEARVDSQNPALGFPEWCQTTIRN